MQSTGRVHMNTCGFKREQVICSDNVWLSEVMFGKRCGTRVCWHPHGRFRDSKRDFLWALAGGITPQQSASIHKIFTRIPQESHKNPTRITLESHKNPTRFSQEFHKSTAQKTAAITSVFHAKTLEYVCHTRRTHEPPENSCNPNETKGLSHVYH